MKNLVMSLVLLMALATVAGAESYIGLFDDTEATLCYGENDLYVTKTVHVIAWLDVGIPAITAAEFRLANLPETGPMGVMTEAWNTPLVIGNAGWNIALAFQVAVPGPLAYLGHLEFFTIDPGWMGADHAVIVRPGYSKGTLAVVDAEFETIPVSGGQYVFNCENPLECDCLAPVPVNGSNWSSVKALY